MGCKNIDTIDNPKDMMKFKNDDGKVEMNSFIELEPDLLTSKDKAEEEIISKYKSNMGLHEEFAKKFDYFNICWYDPNHSNDCIIFKKAFEKVDIIRGFSIESIVNYFNHYSGLEEFILICPGKNGKILIPKIHDNKSLKAIIIYCHNPDYHKDWAKKYLKIKGIISKENELLDKLNEINNNYYFPDYNYDLDNKEISYIILDLKKINKNGYKSHLINALKREGNDLINLINKNKNKYKLFCIKMINYFKTYRKEFIKILESSKSNFIKKILDYNEEETNLMENKLNEFCLFMENLSFVNLYIIKCPYLIETLSYEEVEIIMAQKIDYTLLKEKYDKSKNLLTCLVNNIKNNKNILSEGIVELKKIHEFILSYILIINKSLLFIFKYYCPSRYMMSIDFCLKYFFRLIYRDEIFIIEHQIYYDFYSSIILERKFTEFFSIVKDITSDRLIFSYQEMKKIDYKRNIIVLENMTLKEKIQSIEPNLKINSIIYLKFNDKFKDNLAQHMKKDKYWKLDFIVVLNIRDSIKLYSQLHLISLELGVTFALIIFLENENIYIYKIPLIYASIIPIFLVNNQNQFVKLINEWNSINNIHTIEEKKDFTQKLCKSLNIIIKEKSMIEKNKGWALIDTISEDLFKNSIFTKLANNIYDLTSFFSYIILLYKNNSILDLFFNNYYSLFSSSCTSGLIYDVSQIKRFIFIYTLEEKEKNNSFYHIINKELRSGDPVKIAPFIEMIAFIEKEIRIKELLSYEGKVYRGTCLSKELINEIETGKIMINSSFWSSSKDIEIAKNFLSNSDKANALITIYSCGNNIDIDSEKLTNYINEKEVLFIPFTPFKVLKKKKDKIENKLINIIFLQQDINSKNICNLDNMIELILDGQTYVDECLKHYK